MVIDEAHFNFHTRSGRYRPFGDLIGNDGYAVTAGTEKFTSNYLERIDILVIANARGGDGPPRSADSAFSADEISALVTWLGHGGRLLLIADHAPFGAAARRLGVALGVEMGNGHVFDPGESADDPTFLVFSRENASLPDHAITRGRNAREVIHRVVTFDGQSLGVPRGGTALLVLGPGARESATAEQLDAT